MTATHPLSTPAGRVSDVVSGAAPRRSPGLVPTLTGIEGAAFIVLVVLEGSPLWQLARVGIVCGLTFAALVAERRASPMWRGAVAFTLGVIGVAVGVGIGVMHLVKSDVDASAIAGLVVLAAGLALLAAGAAALWRGTRRWWRLLAIPLVFVTFQFVLMPVTTAVYATNVPHTAAGRATPADRGLSYRDVSLRTSDGVDLAAWYVPSQNGRSVVLLHGSGSDRTTVLDHAAVLARHGYGVLMVDARGHGRSGGDAMDFGWWGDRDIAAAVDYLSAQADVHDGRIAALGLSMGGEEAVGAVAGDNRIRAVVAEGALWRGGMDTGWLAHDFTGIVDRGTLAVQTGVAALLTSAPQPAGLRSAVQAAAPRRILLIATQSEIRGDRWYRDASPENVELWELPGTPHMGGLPKHAQEWESRVVDFLDRTLG